MSRLAALLALPLLGFAFYSLRDTTQQAAKASAMALLDWLAILATRISPLVHELQKERGSTALYLGSQGTPFAHPVTAQRKATDLRDEIASAAQEQRTGLDQVNLAVSQMDMVTQQNAALVPAADDTSRSPDEEAQSLLKEVSRFKIS